MNRQIDLMDQNESLEKGFQLAYLITRNRASALEALTGTLEKLSVQCRRERRRLYWRYNHACGPIRRITRQELDAFQWLIMFESEPYEREQEQRGAYSLRDMLVRYIKHLIQITMYMSSFYVCVGVNRLLYSYSTSETQAAFELVTQRFRGADQYRRAKKMLTDRLRERFGGLVEPIRTRNGEICFKALEDQSQWRALVYECLLAFSPWSTEGWCEHFRPAVDDMPCSGPLGERPTGEPDAQETIYCHIFIDPVCRGNLSALLLSSSPEATLSLPRFAVKEETDRNNSNDSQGRAASKLSAEEKAQIAARLSSSDHRRRRMRPAWASVFVDGVERSRLNLAGPGQLQVELVEGVRLIEIRGTDDGGDLLLGTHLISYTEEAFEFCKVLLPVNKGQLHLAVSPIPSGRDGARAILTLTFTRRFQPVLESLHSCLAFTALCAPAVRETLPA